MATFYFLVERNRTDKMHSIIKNTINHLVAGGL
jgi:hypothetical protein